MAYGNASKKTVPLSALSEKDLIYIAEHINTAYGEKISGLEDNVGKIQEDIEGLKESGGGSGSTQIMFVEIAEDFESDNVRYEFARRFEDIRDWLMNGGYVIGVVGSNGIGNMAFYATQWLMDSVTFTTFMYGMTGITNRSMSLNLLSDESVQVSTCNSINENYISADNEDFKTAVLNCFPDADTMSFPREETVSEVSVE